MREGKLKAVLVSALLLLFLAPVAVPGQGPDDLAAEAAEAAQKGDLNQAIGKLRQALGSDPGRHYLRFQLARLLAADGSYESAATEFDAVVRAEPRNGAARRGEVTAYLLLGRYRDARRKLEQGLVALPRDGQLAHTLARLLASAPVDDVRDGALAVQLAAKVYEIKKTFETTETLAMAHAEDGDFEQALEIQRALISKAEQAGDTLRLEGLRERLLTYLRKEPWRAASPAEIATATEPPERQGAG